MPEADVPVVPNEKQYLGKVCEKHPELQGQRFKCNRCCIACARERTRRLKQNPEVNQRYREQSRGHRKLPEVRKHINHRRRTRGKHFGSLCDKHPELNGFRLPDGSCTRCAEDSRRDVVSGSGTTKGQRGLSCYVGAAGEHLVMCELLSLGIPAYRAAAVVGKHDLVAEFSDGVRTVQVKTAYVNKRTGWFGAKRRIGIVSELLAVVDLINRRIRWYPNTVDRLPEILQLRDMNPAPEKDGSQTTQESK